MAVTQFGKYQLLKRLAVGGMAEIYLARQTGLQGFEKLVVVKIILPNLADDQKFVGMFLDEARLAATLNHPNVVQVYDLGQEKGAYYIAMEFIAGQDLTAVVKKAKKAVGNISIDVAGRIIANAAEALQYAHTLKDNMGRPLNLVHRDVSPSNILVSYSGATKLVDFGIAKAESQNAKTQAGTLKGKYSYMSPELIRGQPIDGRNDVFALGIVFYEVLVGRRLFRRETELAIIHDILEGKVPPPSKLRPEIPAEIDKIVMKAIEKDVKNRYQSAQEMQLAIERFLSSGGHPVTTLDVQAFMEVTFAEENMQYQTLLRELPTASPAKLEAMLAVDAANEGSQATGSSFSGSVPKPLLHPDEEDVLVKKARKGPPLAVVIGGVGALVLAAIGVGFLVKGPSAGEVMVRSEPPGAAILLDGEPTLQKTPAVLKPVKFGPHTIVVRLSGFAPGDTGVMLTKDSASAQVSFELKAQQAAPAELTITTEPAGAEVFIDGRSAGASPVKGKSVESTLEHVVRVHLEGFADETVSVTPAAGEKKSVTLTLKPAAAHEVARADPQPDKTRTQAKQFSLQVSTTPPVDVAVDGKPKGRSPVTVKLPPGKHQLVFTDATLGLKVSQTLNVAKDEAYNREFKKGKLAFSVVPWAHVYIAGKRVGTTPLKPLELWEGDYKVRLLNDDTVGRVHLEASELDIRAISRLTGVDWPLGGTLTGTANADGPLTALKLAGSMQLSHGMLPLDWNGGAVREVGAQFTLDGNAIRIEQATGRYVNGDFGIGGRLDLAKPRTPSIEAVGTGTYQSQPFTFSVKGDAAKPVITTDGHAPFSGSEPVPVPKPAP